jgi:tetratricopeptide (TPR) repeat protein
MTKFYSLLLLSFFYLSACKTATKAYDRGDYNNAIELAIKKLQKDPSDGETKSLLQNAYRFAVDEHQDKIRILSNSTDEARYERIYNEYNYMQNLYEKLRQYPSLSFVKATDYLEYVETYKEKAADVHYQKGLALMEDGEKDDYRRAYLSLKNALKYKSGDAGIRKKMEEAYDLAVVNIVVQPINEYFGGNNGYSYSGSYQMKNFETEIIRGLRNQTNNEFVKFYSEWDARSRDIEPDELLDMRLGRMDIGRPYDQSQTRTVSKEVVIKEIVHKPDSVEKVYGKVQAQITTTRRTLVSTGDLHVTSRNAKGLILWNDIFRGEHKWEVHFATYRGDERALSDSDRSLINNQNDRNAPREDEITEAILRQIQNEMNYRIRNHYNRYY